MEKIDYDLLARLIVNEIKIEVRQLVQKQLKEIAFQLELFADNYHE